MHFFEGPIRRKDNGTQDSDARRSEIHHFPSPVRTSGLEINLPGAQAPADDEVYGYVRACTQYISNFVVIALEKEVVMCKGGTKAEGQ